LVIVQKVTGSAEQAVPLVIGVDTVYVHTNIKQIESIGNQGAQYEYDESQYTIAEYLLMEAERMKAELVSQKEVTDLLLLDSLEV